MEVLIFAKISKKYYDSLTKELKKKHDDEYIDNIFTHHKTKKLMFVYDEDCYLTKTDFDLIAEYSKPTNVQAGILMQGKSMSSIFFNNGMAIIKQEKENTDWSREKDIFVHDQTIDYRIVIKRELTRIYAQKQNINESVLEEILEQIPVCEDMHKGLSDSQILSWLACTTATQVSMKARTLKFA